MRKLGWVVAIAGVLVLAPRAAQAHCDGLDGPVVKTAMRALERGDVNLVLPWVHASDEAAIRDAFQRTLAVRRQSPEARALADTWFFETLVRVHRAGEGAPYTGLKPAGRDLGPAIPAADRALETGNVDAAVRLLTDAVARTVRARFQAARATRNYRADDLEAGRRHVAAYVTFIHAVEGIYRAASGSAEGHHDEPAEEGRAAAPRGHREHHD